MGLLVTCGSFTFCSSWEKKSHASLSSSTQLHCLMQIRLSIKSSFQDSNSKGVFMWGQSLIVIDTKTLTNPSYYCMLPLDFLSSCVLQDFTLDAVGNQPCPSKSCFLLLHHSTTGISRFIENIHKRVQQDFIMLLQDYVR